MTEMPGRVPMVIRNIPDAIAAIPYLLGFHPSDSLIVIAFGGPHGTCAIRLNLPSAGTPEAAERLAAMMAANEFRQALILGYGPENQVVKAALATGEHLLARGIFLADAARVADGRWWSLTCRDSDCCPEDGRPYDSSATAVAAQATYAGHVALADRTALAGTVAPLTGPARTSMNKATQQAKQRFENWGKRLPPPQFHRRITKEGLTFLNTLDHQPPPPKDQETSTKPEKQGSQTPHEPIAKETPTHPPQQPAAAARLSRRRRLSDDEVAWLGILLANRRIRDEAWIRIDHDDPSEDIAFWRDILRRVDEQYADAPACLLAYAAYVAGNGGLANVALERASPHYSMAALIREVIEAGIPPSEVRIRMTPDELADAYADLDEDENPLAS